VLVFVHEAGHFLAAKAFGVRVDEFGLGYPPKAKSLFRWRGTEFTLNWLPFGGFVKIFGENYEQEEAMDARATVPTMTGSRERQSLPRDSFQYKNRGIQALILVAGVLFNFLFAGILFSVGFMMGMPAPVDIGLPVDNAHTAITQVLGGSPAADAGLKPGDEVLLATRGAAQADLAPDKLSNFISSSAAPLSITVKRNNEIFTKSLTPASGIVEGKPAVGFGLAEVGTTQLGFWKSIPAGFRTAWELTQLTASAFWHFIREAFSGHADLSQVSGPVGIVSLVGEATALGFTYLLSFAAIISINLAVLNLFPFPALDGGRLLFVIIEAITRRRVPPKVFNWINTVGFALLVLLMILVTIRDVRHIL